MKKFATQELVNTAEDLPATELFIPEWDCWVKIRTMTGPERDAWENSLVDTSGDEPQIVRKGRITRLCAICLAGEDGKPLYGLDNEAQLNGKSGSALYRIFRKAFEWNKLGSIGDEEKNSGSALGGASLSASLSNGDALPESCLLEPTPAN